jgi:hypothetical protein
MANWCRKTHREAQLIWEEGCRVGTENKDYPTAIGLIEEALNVIKESKAFDAPYKTSRYHQFHRQLTLFSLKLGDLETALKYAKLCNQRDLLGDVYYEMERYKECLDSYTILSKPHNIYPGWDWHAADRIPQNRIAKIVRSFFELSKKDPERYSVECLRKHYRWLFEQVISKFNTLENAFHYYRCDKKRKKKKTFEKSKTELKLVKDKVKKIKHKLSVYRNFEKFYYERINLIGDMLNKLDLRSAKKELLKLYEVCDNAEIQGNTHYCYSANLITDIVEIHLLQNESDKAIEWALQHFDNHWRMIDYYLNVKFLFNKDLDGNDIVNLGFSQEYRNNIASIYYKGFYTPSNFAFRHKMNIKTICEKLFQDYRSSLGQSYLKYLYVKYGKYVDEEKPVVKYGGPYLRWAVYPLFGGRHGKYKLEKDLILPDIPSKIQLKKEIPYKCAEGGWIHIFFSDCKDLIEAVSELNFKSENICRLDRGVPERGKGWSSENEIYAFVNDLFADYEAYQHFSPEWLSPKHLDVYIPHLQFAIEYQGKQHYEPIEFFGGEDAFRQIQVRDRIKAKLCKDNNIKLLCIRYDDENPEQTILDFIHDEFNLSDNKRNSE